MKILIIGYMHSKNDKRVLKTVELLSRNNEVIYQYYSKKDEKSYKDNNITYIPIKYSFTSDNSGVKTKLENLKNLLKMEKKIIRLISEIDYDVLYFHYFLLFFPLKAFKIAKKRNKKIIYDIHEYHPENYFKNFKGIKKSLKEKYMWYILKKQFIMSNKLIFVSKEMQNDMCEKLKIEKSYLIVPNYANFSLESKEKKKDIVLVGKTPRNIENEKEVIKKLISYGFKFKIIGFDSEHFKDIPHEYTSFLPYNEMMEELSKSAFSLISYGSFGNDKKNYIYSFPHKFFDSIAAGTPVIVRKDFVSMVKEVEKYNIGVVIEPKNVKDSVRKILDAYENYDRILEDIKRHKNLYIWDKEKEEKFINFVLT